MNWEAAGAIGEIIGALAVVVSLVYLARQIHHSAKAERSSAEQEIAGRLTDLFATAGASEMGYAFHVGMKDLSDLTPEQQSKFLYFSAAWFRTIEQAYMQYRKGNLSADIWEGYENYLRMTLNSPTIQDYWKDRRAMFNSGFRDLVDSIEPTPGIVTSSELLDNLTNGNNPPNESLELDA